MIQIFQSLKVSCVRNQNSKGPVFLSGKQASRQAIENCLNSAGLISHDLGIVDHLYLRQYPEYAVSLAHTAEWGAAIIGKRPKFLSIGIDLEKADRKVSKKIHKFFINSNDQVGLEPLEIWVRKEAAFKAFFPLRDRQNLFKTYVLNDLWLIDNYFGLNGSRYPLGEVVSESYKGLILAKAVIL
jgi:hypothetical protein